MNGKQEPAVEGDVQIGGFVGYSENRLKRSSVSLYLEEMDSLTRAAGVIHRAEAELRALVSERASAGDYASVVKIASWARVLATLIVAPASASSTVHRPRQGTAERGGTKGEVQAQRSPRSGKKEAYPKFFRRGEQIVRVAWSKRDKKEYQHKSPHSAVKALARAIAQLGAEGRVFTAEELLPIQHDDGTDIPSYQAYAGIALFKQTGLIDQHGRQGYSIPNPAEFQVAAEAVLKKLPELST